YGLVAGSQRIRRRAGNFKLIFRIFGKIAIGVKARRMQCGQKYFAKTPMSPDGIKAIAITISPSRAAASELTLKCNVWDEPGLFAQLYHGIFQERTRAHVPWRAVRVQNVTKEKMLAGRVVLKIQMHFGVPVGHEDQVAEGTPGCFGDRPQSSDE